MRLRVEVEPYRRRLSVPLATGHGTLAERAGYLVRIADEQGCVGTGEAAPIYWIDDDPLDTVGACLAVLHGRRIDIDALESIDDVASRMATKFTLKNGVFTYRGLSFNVKGASIRLDGTHSLRSKAVDLSGVVLLNATVSQTQTGYRSWLLKPFDPLFRKNGAGTRLVIKVAGTQDQPKVGLEVGRTLRGQ